MSQGDGFLYTLNLCMRPCCSTVQKQLFALTSMSDYSGKNVVVLEARCVGAGQTGRSPGVPAPPSGSSCACQACKQLYCDHNEMSPDGDLPRHIRFMAMSASLRQCEGHIKLMRSFKE